MAIYRGGNALAKLVREISYTKGDLNGLESAARSVRDQMQPLIARHKELRAEYRALRAKLTELEMSLINLTGLSADEVRDIRRVPKVLGLAHGTFTRELVALLKEANEPSNTCTIAGQMAQRLGFPNPSVANYNRIRRSVKEKLGYLASRGVVERLPGEPLENGRVARVWRWKEPSAVSGDGCLEQQLGRALVPVAVIDPVL